MGNILCLVGCEQGREKAKGGEKGQGWVRGKVCALRNWRSQRGEPGVQVLSQGVIAPFLPEGGQMVARSTPKASVEHKMTREGTSLHGTPEGCS